ncbi:MAG: hypothetical protein JXA93_04590 [Anaerolineae bacterium]|nr:hypothetical protein [Anaerolineae bacterium]
MKRTLLSALIVCLLLPPAAGAQAEVWQPLVGPRGGSVAVVAISPDYPTDRTAFAGFRGQGVYRTDDGTLSWHLAGPSDWIVVDLALSPTFDDDGTLLAVHGLWTTGYEVHRSTDRGGSWAEVTPAWTQPPALPRLSISPDLRADGTVYVTAGAETFVSVDGGMTFVPAGGWFAGHTVSRLVFSPEYGTDDTLFALVSGDGLYRSEDAGATWAPAGPGVVVSAFAVSPNYGEDTLVVAVAEADGHLYLSTDGGGAGRPWGWRSIQAGSIRFPFRPLSVRATP